MTAVNTATSLPRESDLVAALCMQIHVCGLPAPVREWRFHPPRRWRADLAYPGQGVVVECEGGTFTGGRHTRGAGYRRDLEKYNQAALDGYTVLRFDAALIASGVAVRQIQAAWEEGEAVRRATIAGLRRGLAVIEAAESEAQG